jgi:hypothetical protein
MKFTKITLSVALLGALTLGMADDTAQTDNNTNNSIDAKIEKIQNAPAQERVKLMNEFKQQLAKMNQEDRMEAISQMQEKMQGINKENMQDRQNEAHAKYTDAQERQGQMHEMGHDRQAEAMEHMNQMQNMNQAQAGNQMQHMIQNGGQGTGGMSSQGEGMRH